MVSREIVTGQELGRRMRAARALAGLRLEDLTERVNEPGLGFATLGNIERGDRPLRRMEMLVIAEALSVPPAWFHADVDIPAAVAASEKP